MLPQLLLLFVVEVETVVPMDTILSTENLLFLHQQHSVAPLLRWRRVLHIFFKFSSIPILFSPQSPLRSRRAVGAFFNLGGCWALVDFSPGKQQQQQQQRQPWG